MTALAARYRGAIGSIVNGIAGVLSGPTTITTSTAATATAYSNQRKIDRCQNGVLWSFHSAGYEADEQVRAYYSTNNGVNWTQDTGLPSGAGTAGMKGPNCSIFIDLDDYLHVVYKSSADGYIYYRRGTPNAGRTAWTWSAATVVYNTDTNYNYPDVVAHREGTGWVAHVVYSVTQGLTSPTNVKYKRSIITSGQVIGAFSTEELALNNRPGTNTNSAWGSIDFNHTGDGKTVAGSTPHLYVAGSAGATGAGYGIRFKKATYSGGTWTWGTEREIDNTRYVDAAARWLNCVFDGTRVVIAGQVYTGSSHDLVAYDRDVADTTTTTAFTSTGVATSSRVHGGSLTYDGEGNLYFSGVRQSTFAVGYRKWTRLGATLGSFTDIDATSVMSDAFISAKRGYSNNRIEFIYTDGASSPYDVRYGGIS